MISMFPKLKRQVIRGWIGGLVKVASLWYFDRKLNNKIGQYISFDDWPGMELNVEFVEFYGPFCQPTREIGAPKKLFKLIICEEIDGAGLKVMH